MVILGYLGVSCEEYAWKGVPNNCKSCIDGDKSIFTVLLF